MPWAVLIGVAVIAAVIGYLAFSEVGKALVYYLTPTELLAKGQAAYEETVRLGGLVKPDTKHGPDTNLSFTLTDGSTEIQVHTSVASIVVKHDENYVAPTNGAVPSHIAPGS